MISEYVILTAFPWQNGFVNVPQCNVTRNLPVMFWFQE